MVFLSPLAFEYSHDYDYYTCCGKNNYLRFLLFAQMFSVPQIGELKVAPLQCDYCYCCIHCRGLELGWYKKYQTNGYYYSATQQQFCFCICHMDFSEDGRKNGTLASSFHLLFLICMCCLHSVHKLRCLFLFLFSFFTIIRIIIIKEVFSQSEVNAEICKGFLLRFFSSIVPNLNYEYYPLIYLHYCIYIYIYTHISIA